MSSEFEEDDDPKPSPSPSPSPIIIDPTLTNNGKDSAQADKAAKDAIQLFMTNRFLSVDCNLNSTLMSPRLGLLSAVMSFIKASSTHGEDDINNSIAHIWTIEKYASKVAQSKDTFKQLQGYLLQADTHLLGACLQLITQSYVKAAWNIRKSYKFYDSVNKSINKFISTNQYSYTNNNSTTDTSNNNNNNNNNNSEANELEEVQAWCEFGVGMFHLLISLLPSSVIKIAEWIGFAGDRIIGLKQLNSSVKRNKFMSPFSALLLLNYYVVISVFTGEQTKLHFDAARELLEWGRVYYPGGILFALMDSRLARCEKDLEKAIQLADQAVLDSYELPAVCTLFYFQKAWCSFFLLDFEASAQHLDQLLSPVQINKKKYPAAADAARISVKGVKEDEEFIYVPPAPASAQAFYAFHAGLCCNMFGNHERANAYYKQVKNYIVKKRQRPIDLYAERRANELLSRYNSNRLIFEDFVLDVNEMILAWNGYTQMSTVLLLKLSDMIKAARENEKKKSFSWDLVDQARSELYYASVLRALSLDFKFDPLVKGSGDGEGRGEGYYNEAEGLLINLALKLEKLETNKSAIACGLAAFAGHEFAHMALSKGDINKAQAAVTKAQSYKNYDLFNMLQIRLHGLQATIKSKK